MAKKKRVKKYNPNKLNKLLDAANLKDVGTYFISGVTKLPEAFNIKTGNKINLTNSQITSLELNPWYWYVDCAVLVREKNLKEKVIKVAYHFSAPYFHSDPNITDYLNEKHKELMDSLGQYKDLIITAAWVAIPIYKPEYGLDDEGKNNLPPEYLYDFYTKQGAFNYIAKWEQESVSATKQN